MDNNQFLKQFENNEFKESSQILKEALKEEIVKITPEQKNRTKAARKLLSLSHTKKGVDYTFHINQKKDIFIQNIFTGFAYVGLTKEGELIALPTKATKKQLTFNLNDWIKKQKKRFKEDAHIMIPLILQDLNQKSKIVTKQGLTLDTMYLRKDEKTSTLYGFDPTILKTIIEILGNDTIEIKTTTSLTDGLMLQNKNGIAILPPIAEAKISKKKTKNDKNYKLYSTIVYNN